MTNSIKKNPTVYLEHLEYMNKAKKMKEEEHLRKFGHNIRKEENFQLFFNGANDERVRNRKRSELEASKSPSNRKKWGNQQSIYRKK